MTIKITSQTLIFVLLFNCNIHQINVIDEGIIAALRSIAANHMQVSDILLT